MYYAYFVLTGDMYLGGTMTQQTCIIFANCQGDNLAHLLNSTPNFSNKFRIKQYTIHEKEQVEDSELQKCKLFFYQFLGEHWGAMSSKNLLQKLPTSAISMQIPNMFFNGYWPFWTNTTVMAYQDLYLEELCSRNLNIQEVLYIYLRCNIHAQYDIEALRQKSRVYEIKKEENLEIRTVNFIEERWQEQQLFYTINHPKPILSIYVAEGILRSLGLGELPISVRNDYLKHVDDFDLPIHPQVGSFYKLPFVSEERMYNVYGCLMPFKDYITAYVNCRLRKEQDELKDFICFLNALAQTSKARKK